MNFERQQGETARFIGKLLRENFGKGPESVYVHIEKELFTVYLRNFLSPTERVLIDQDQERMFHKTRDTIIQSLLPEIRAFVLLTTGMEMDSFYYDWGVHNGSGIIIGVSTTVQDLWTKGQEDYPGKQAIHDRISEISREVQKTPKNIFSLFLNPRTFIVIREGILVGIEKELIREGLEETLRIIKRRSEKKYFHNNQIFEVILKTKIKDVFVDWNFNKDASVILFILEPNQDL